MPMRDRASASETDHRYTRRQAVERLASAAAAMATGGLLVPLRAGGGVKKRVIVIGAGLAGLCTAFELDALGHDVVVLEAQARPGGRVHTLRSPFSDGLYAEAGASRIPTSHDLTLAYARLFGLRLVPFEPRDLPFIRYAYRQRAKVLADDSFEWPASVPVGQRQLTPAQVRRRYIEPLADQIVDPFAADWLPSSLANTTGSRATNICAANASLTRRST